MARIDDFLKALMEKKGSDLHLCSGLPPKIRIHGRLEPLPEEPISAEQMLDILHEICPKDRWEHYRSNLDMDFAYELRGLARFRVNYMNNHYGPGAVLRIIPTKILTLEELNLPPVLKEVCEYPSGLVLVTGPTGSGKSTTLAAMIDYINTRFAKHIITIEDPIEFVHRNKGSIIVQREVGSDTESFDVALRGAIRADPDIILVGEMRDLETINLALTCAAMGMLVFGTLHTNNAPKTIDRIIDAFPRDGQEQIRTMLSESLKGVVCQQLLKVAEGKGRVAAMEIMVGTPAIANLIREGKTFQIPSIIQTARKDGMQLMDQHILDLLKTKRITPEEAYRCAQEKKQFEQYLPAREAVSG